MKGDKNFCPSKNSSYVYDITKILLHSYYILHRTNCGRGNFGGKCQELAYIGRKFSAYLKIVMISTGAKSFLRK